MKPCLHCEIGKVVQKWMDDHPKYDKEEVLMDIFNVARQFVEHHGGEFKVVGPESIQSSEGIH